MRTRIRAIVCAIALALPIGAVAQSSYDIVLKAANQGDTQTVGSLLAQGLDPNTADGEGYTLLMIAARGGHAELVSMLLARKAGIARRSPHGDTALLLASLKGHLPVVKVLVESGAAVKTPGWAPVHYAAFEGRAEVLNYLIEKGADKNALGPNGFTPLMLAARGGHLDACKALLGWDADFRIEGPKGETALKIAQARKDVALEALLKRAGAVD